MFVELAMTAKVNWGSLKVNSGPHQGRAQGRCGREEVAVRVKGRGRVCECWRVWPKTMLFILHLHQD
jgi:hypothetical protein